MAVGIHNRVGQRNSPSVLNALYNKFQFWDGRAPTRALDSLAAAGKVQSLGRGRARRWTTPFMPGFTTTLLLPASLPID